MSQESFWVSFIVIYVILMKKKMNIFTWICATDQERFGTALHGPKLFWIWAGEGHFLF